MNKKIVHDALVLMAFSLVLGGILGAVYQITLPAITQAEYEKTQEAYMAVFADAESFEELEFDKTAAAEMMAAKGFKDSIDNVQKAIVGGEVLVETFVDDVVAEFLVASRASAHDGGVAHLIP